MEAIWNSLLKVGTQYFRFDSFIVHWFGVPHDELRIISLPVMNSGHDISVIFLCKWINSISRLEIDFTGWVVWPKTDSSDNFLLLEIILDEPIVKDIITAYLKIWLFLCQIMYGNIAIPALVAIVGLAKIWEFQVQVLYKILGFHLSSSQVKLHSLQDWSFIVTKNIVLIVLKIHVHILIDDRKQNNNCLTFVIHLIPWVSKVETIMCRAVKPNDISGIGFGSIEHAISSWVWFMILEQPRFIFYRCFDVKFNWKIRDHDVVLSHDKIMDHSSRCYRNFKIFDHLSMFIK